MIEVPIAESIAAPPISQALAEVTAPVQSRAVWEPKEILEPTPTARKRAVDYEEFVIGRGLAWVGGLAVLIGAVFFLSLAFSRGWIGPSARVVIGVAAATIFILGGGYFFERKDATFGNVLVSGGLGIMSLSMLAATRLYDLIPIEIGLGVTLASAGLAALIAVRANLQIVAGYGIVAAMAAPPILGADPNGATIAFLAAALVGTTCIALYKTWRWLAPLAFVLTAPQFAVWVLDDAPATVGILALAGFWVLQAVSAGGEEFRIRKWKLSPSSATLMLANAAFLVWAGFNLLDGENADLHGVFLFGVAIAHGILGGYFLRNEGDRHPFGMLAFGTGLAALTMAVPVQFGGNVVTLAWISEAAALAWVYSRLRNPYGGGAALLLGGMAIAHLLTFEYRFIDLANPDEPSRVLANANGLTLAYVLVALAFAGYVLKTSGFRRWMVCIGGLLLIWSMPFEFSGVALVGVWVIISMLAVVSTRWSALSRTDDQKEPAPIGLGVVEELGERIGILVPAVVAYLLAMIHFFAFQYPPSAIAEASNNATSFIHNEGLALAFLIAGAFVPARLVGSGWQRFGLANLCGALLIWVMPFEVSGVTLVGGWSLVAVVATLAGSWAPLLSGPEFEQVGNDHSIFPFRTKLTEWGLMPVAAAGWLLALGHLVTVEYPFDNIGSATASGIPFLNLNGLALAIVLVASAFIGSGRFSRILWTALAVFALIYAMPFETSNLALVGGWTLITALAMAAGRWEPLATALPGSLDRADGEESYEASLVRGGQTLLHGGPLLPAVSAWLLALVHFIVVELEADSFTDWTRPVTPFTDSATLAALMVIAAAVVGSFLTTMPAIRVAWRNGAILVAASLMPFQIGLAATVVAWSALAIVALSLMDRDAVGAPAYRSIAALLAGGSLLVAITRVAPPERLFVDATSPIDHALLWSGATAAFGALALALAFAFWKMRSYPQSKWIAVGAGALFVYMLSVGIVDHFQSQVGPESSLESLQKQAQVALSILWAVLGGAIFVAGVLRFGLPIRIFGLQLLGLATAKVFIWDMSTLDASYRVLSFIGLGILLLGSSMLYQRYVKHPDDSDKAANSNSDKKNDHHWHLPGGFHRGHSA